ncbi:MAG: class II glutamine amidotransferase [Wenzhouxiangellaceae bacterium]|nr:class II glutamine amidotransferase [Wenzhouxiangellaceae bacterium]
MCRFTHYMGDEIAVADLVTRPDHSLIHQATHAKERPEPLNGDGFGLAWYVPDDPVPARFRSLTPAWSNANLAELARVTRSRCIMAHVRAATSGKYDVSEANCHPFRCGPFALMHNGDIPAFGRIRRPLMEGLSDSGFTMIRGNTDSEHIFALAMERLRGREEDSDCTLLAEALEGAIRDVLELLSAHAPDSHAYLNLVLTDGRHAVASRFSTNADYIDSLYINRGERYRCEDGECAMGDPGDSAGAVLLSSEPLTASERWRSVPRNHIVTIDADLETGSRELECGRLP